MSDESDKYETLNIKKTLDAPREKVWDAWTDPEKLGQWYAPRPYTAVCELDVRPGGAVSIAMKSPEGMVFPSTGEYKVVEEPGKLSFTNAPTDGDGNKLFEVQHTVTLTEEDGKTLLDVTSEVLSAGPGSARFLNGMHAGLNQAIVQLDDLVSN